MKKIICLIFALLFILCGCTNAKNEKEINTEIVSNSEFSYEKDLSHYTESVPGVKTSNFVNTTPAEIKTSEQAIELAKKEVSLQYDTIAVEYDADAKVYKVCFYKKDSVGGDISVYLNQNGITLLTVAGE